MSGDLEDVELDSETDIEPEVKINLLFVPTVYSDHSVNLYGRVGRIGSKTRRLFFWVNSKLVIGVQNIKSGS